MFLRTQFIFLLALIAITIPYAAMAQISTPGTPKSFITKNLRAKNTIPKYTTPRIDLATIEQEDIADEAAGLPPRFGYPFEVDYNLKNTGLWETLANGDRIWRFTIKTQGAKSINLLYNDFYLPPSARFFLYNSETGQTLGAFSHINNKEDAYFATGLVYGEQITLEYYEPAAVKGQGRIGISTVVHGYRYIPNPKSMLDYGTSGSCHVNTTCPQGDTWRDEIKAIGMMVIGGTRWCSGALYGNTAMDCTARYVTANHCLSSFDAITNSNASTMSFIWRYESPNCPNGGAGNDGPTNMTTVGAIIEANNGNPGNVEGTDFAVIRLVENPVNANYDIYFLGWDAAATNHAAATGIHHPDTDVKKISMENDPLLSTQYYGNTSSGANDTHWRVADWDSGTTEPGSSGSPLINNATRRAIGHLSGGDAACGNNAPDWYGQTKVSWNNFGTTDPRRRMRDWLDSANTGATFVDGYYPTSCPVPDCNDGIQNGDETGVDCGGSNCLPCPCETTVTLTLNFDDYPEETTWTIQNSVGSTLASGGPYGSQADGSTLVISDICVDLECLVFSINDSESDGMCCGFGNGSYTLVNDLDNSTIASGGNFGATDLTNFCIEGVSVNPKVILNGPYNGTDMNTDLKTNGLLPTTSPYGDGATTTAAVIAAYDIVDWVEVQLRQPTGPNYNIVAKRGALLKKDGTVVHTDGYTPVTFPEATYSGAVDGIYRIAIQHRNHLGVMTNTDYTLD